MKSFVVLASFAIILVPLMLGVQPAGVAFCYFIVNAAGTIVLWFLLRRKISWISLGVQHARRRAIRRLWIPAISMMSIPFANVLSLQGILFVVGHVSRPIAVVTYSTARTVSRSASQMMQLVNNSVWPEISAAFGAGNIKLARRLHSRACQISIFLCLSMAIFIALVGRFVWKAWTIGLGSDRFHPAGYYAAPTGGFFVLVHQLRGSDRSINIIRWPEFWSYRPLFSLSFHGS